MNTPSYTIRPANAADSDTIKRMVRSEPLNPNAVDWQYFLVLEVIEKGSPVIAAIGMAKPAGDVYEIDSVTTRPQYRKRGYGAAVVQALIDRSPRPLYLLAEPALVPFYERLGFHIIEPELAHAAVREEAEYVNRHWGTYHIMVMPHHGATG